MLAGEEVLGLDLEKGYYMNIECLVRSQVCVLDFTETKSLSLNFSPVTGSVPLSVMYFRINLLS